MLKTVKQILYNIGLLKPKTSVDIINYLLYKRPDLYSKKFRFIEIESYFENILIYISELEKIKNQDLLNNRIEIKLIPNTAIKKVYVSKWFTNNGQILEEDVFKKFLLISKDLIKKYNLIKSLISNNIPYSNSVRLQHYIINIESILYTLYQIEREHE